jgi:hypothetical protein
MDLLSFLWILSKFKGFEGMGDAKSANSILLRVCRWAENKTYLHVSQEFIVDRICFFDCSFIWSDTQERSVCRGGCAKAGSLKAEAGSGDRCGPDALGLSVQVL